MTWGHRAKEMVWCGRRLSLFSSFLWLSLVEMREILLSPSFLSFSPLPSNFQFSRVPLQAQTPYTHKSAVPWKGKEVEDLTRDYAKGQLINLLQQWNQKMPKGTSISLPFPLIKPLPFLFVLNCRLHFSIILLFFPPIISSSSGSIHIAWPLFAYRFC